MDPNATLQEIEGILQAPTPDEDRLSELSDALSAWLGKGGFAPDWESYPTASRWYHLLDQPE